MKTLKIFIQNNLISLLILCLECAIKNYVTSVFSAKTALSLFVFQQKINIALSLLSCGYIVKCDEESCIVKEGISKGICKGRDYMEKLIFKLGHGDTHIRNIIKNQHTRN